MLVFQSFYEDIIWKAVELAKEKGYKIDGMYTFTTVTGDPPSGDVNFIVAMSSAVPPAAEIAFKWFSLLPVIT